MATSRWMATILFLIATAPGANAQTYSLAETAKAGDCYRIHLEMKLDGELRVSKDSKTIPIKIVSNAAHDFPERTLSVAASGLADKTVRLYESAKAEINVDRDSSKRALRPERRLFVVQRSKDQPITYSPAGTLTREELELTEHFDTLALTGLLPGKAVAVGETWKPANPVVQALCNFEGLTDQTLTCTLVEVREDIARVSVKGSATGIDLGALAKLTIDAAYQFDLKSNHLTRLDWKQNDVRDQGPASPAMSLDTTTTLTRAPVDQPAGLSDVALVSVPDGFEVPGPLTDLEFQDVKKRYKIVYQRSWQTVSETDEHLVLRLIEQGDFLAQATITPWTRAEKGMHLSADEFRQAMAATPGWEQEQELQAGEVMTGDGRWIYRISALGQLDGSKIMQNFYLIANSSGDQVVVVFTFAPKQADRLGTRDLSLAVGIEMPKK